MIIEAKLSKQYPYPIIAREGWFFLSIAIITAIIVTFINSIWSILFWIIAILILQFFRDPQRIIPESSDTILSPADGRIIVVTKAYDPYVKREALKISIFMNIFNVHSNRAPVDGKIETIQYFPGKFFNANLDKASLENERNALAIKTIKGQIVTCVQIGGLIARRILCYVAAGDILVRGQRYGFIRFGSRVDVYLPLTVTPKVSVGEKVLTTETILAYF